MTSGADLFVVCKQCGSEVSPYITECPYCGGRLRRRAPKLPRAGQRPRHPRRARLAALLTRPAARRRAGVATEPRARRSDRWASTRPYATILIVLLSCASWVVIHAEPVAAEKLAIEGPLHGHWWKLLTSPFAYPPGTGVAAFVTIIAIAIFGWLLERRHGPAIVLIVFFGASVTGALVALSVYQFALVTTANAGALALLCAWAVPDLMAARSRSYYDGDLLGATVIAALLLVLPFAYVDSEISWLAGVVGAAFGLLVGLGLQLREPVLDA